MTIQRRFAPIGGRFDPESLAGLTGISKQDNILKKLKIAAPPEVLDVRLSA
jgi:hypothetical protein